MKSTAWAILSLRFNRPRIGITAFLASVILLVQPTAWSQQQHFERRPMPIVVPASVLITEANGKAYVLSESLEMTRRPDEALARLRASGLQARVFAVDRREAEPHVFQNIDDCLVYLSSVIPIAANWESTINLGTLNEAWLKVQRGKPPEDGRFLLVFERSKDERQLFRLEGANRHGYFQAGFYFEVRAPSPVTTSYSQRKFDALADANEASRPFLEQATREMTDSKGRALPCYRFQAIHVASDSQGLAYLEACGEDAAL